MNINEAIDIFNGVDIYDEKALKTKYRQLIKKYHPDICKTGEDKTKDINGAKEIIDKYLENHCAPKSLSLEDLKEKILKLKQERENILISHRGLKYDYDKLKTKANELHQNINQIDAEIIKKIEKLKKYHIAYPQKTKKPEDLFLLSVILSLFISIPLILSAIFHLLLLIFIPISVFFYIIYKVRVEPIQKISKLNFKKAELLLDFQSSRALLNITRVSLDLYSKLIKELNKKIDLVENSIKNYK